MEKALLSKLNVKSDRSRDSPQIERRLSGPKSSITKKFGRLKFKKKIPSNSTIERQRHLLSLLSDSTNSPSSCAKVPNQKEQITALAHKLPTPDSLDLNEIIGDSALLDDFHSFLEGQYCEEVLEFWLDCQEYKKVFKQGDSNRIRTKGIEINTKYFSFAASKPINVDHEAKLHVTRDLTHFKENTFLEAEQQSLHLIITDCYPRYYLQTMRRLDAKFDSMFCKQLENVSTQQKESTLNFTMDTSRDFSICSSSTRLLTTDKTLSHKKAGASKIHPSRIVNLTMDSSESGNTTYYSIESKSTTISKAPNFETLCEMLEGDKVVSADKKNNQELRYYVEALDNANRTTQ